MRVLFVNYSFGKGSTGKIVADLENACKKSKIQSFCCYIEGPKTDETHFKIGTKFEIKINSLKSHLFGNYGFESTLITSRLIKIINKINPDIIHIHNIHSHDINIKKLSKFLLKQKKKVILTFHDCWLFTGYCPYYTFIGCEKWKSGCEKCPIKSKFSFFFDKSKSNYKRKRKYLQPLNSVVVSPSNWLTEETKQSFFSNSKIITIHNGVNQQLFKPCKSTIRAKYNLDKKIILLGVAYEFDERKGIDTFLKLAADLDDNFKIILVGNCKLEKPLPDNVLHLGNRLSQTELAEIYSTADCLINPTKEDNYPTTHLEALSCGLPVITYDVGGASEMINSKNGIIIKKNNYQELVKAIKDKKYLNLNRNLIIQDACRFNKNKFTQEYINLYYKLMN